jgi:hypothetical protein
MLCYAMLCYAMLCDAMRCYAMLCDAMLSSASVIRIARELLGPLNTWHKAGPHEMRRVCISYDATSGTNGLATIKKRKSFFRSSKVYKLRLILLIIVLKTLLAYIQSQLSDHSFSHFRNRQNSYRSLASHIFFAPISPKMDIFSFLCPFFLWRIANWSFCIYAMINYTRLVLYLR